MFLYGTKSSENNGPNGLQPAQYKTPSVSFTKTDTYEGIGLRLTGLCFYVSVVVRRFATGDVFCLFAMNSLNLSRPRLLNLAKI